MSLPVYICMQLPVRIVRVRASELRAHGSWSTYLWQYDVIHSNFQGCHVLLVQPEVMVAVARNAHSFLKSFNSTGQVVTLWSPFSVLMSRSSIRGARIWLSTCLRTYQLNRASALPRPSRHAVREPASSETLRDPNLGVSRLRRAGGRASPHWQSRKRRGKSLGLLGATTQAVRCQWHTDSQGAFST